METLQPNRRDSQQYRRSWFLDYWRLCGLRHRRFEVAPVGATDHPLPRNPEEDHAWRDEAVRECRLDQIQLQTKYYEQMAASSGLLGSGGPFGRDDVGGLAKVIATAANASSLIPLSLMAASYKRLTIASAATVSTSEMKYHVGLEFAAVVLEHVYKVTRPESAQQTVKAYLEDAQAGKDTFLHRLRDHLDASVPHGQDIYFYDFQLLMRSTALTDVHWLEVVNMAEEQAGRRRRAATSWSPPFEGVVTGACRPFEASMLDVYAVQSTLRRREHNQPSQHRPPPQFVELPAYPHDPYTPGNRNDP
ncbi:hypothetical protein JCM8547_002504 [Rhodosporidiobolus lusitaniae]